MTAAWTELANRALDAVGSDNIASLDDDSKAARLCKRHIFVLLDGLMRRHPWNCAMARVALPALATSPAWGFAYAYQLPADCLRVLTIDARDPMAPYKIEQKRIVGDMQPPLNVMYIARPTDPGQLDPLVADTLVSMLGRELAKPLCNDGTLYDRLAKQALDNLRDARSADAAEGSPDLLWSDTLIDARRI